MSTECIDGAFILFLKEFKKITPRNDETDAIHQLADDLIHELRTSSVIYIEEYDDWISPSDIRFWQAYRQPKRQPVKKPVKKSLLSRLIGADNQSEDAK